MVDEDKVVEKGMIHMEIIQTVCCFQMTRLIFRGVGVEAIHEKTSDVFISLRTKGYCRQINLCELFCWLCGQF